MAFRTPADFEGDCLVCCRKCKGLFPIEQDIVKHIQTCNGSPHKSPCCLFACERKIFLQLFALGDIQEKNVNNSLHGLEEELNMQDQLHSQSHFIQGTRGIGSQIETTEQSLFLPGNQQIVSHQIDEDHTKYLQATNGLDSQTENASHSQFMTSNSSTESQCQGADQGQSIKKSKETVSAIAENSAKAPNSFFPSKMAVTSVTSMDSQQSLMPEPVSEEHPASRIKPSYLSHGNEDKVKSAIARNLKYLQDTNLTRIPSPIEKQLGLFCDSRLSFPRLQSPLEKQFQTRIQSPVDKAINFLGEPGSSAPALPSSTSQSLSCSQGIDYFGNYTTQDDNLTGLPSIEEFPTLQYLDLAKKDPFWGQNIGLPQINTKDPFLINAAEPSEKLSGQKIAQMEKSTEDIIHSSPTLQLQDENYFNFASTLDEPTQLDYLDLATLDFLTNPNLGCYTGLGPWRPDRCPSDKEDNIYPGDLMSVETNPFSGETVAGYALSHSLSSEDLYTHSQHTRPGDSKCLFKPISKSNRSKAISKRTKAQSLRKKVAKGIDKVRKDSNIENTGEPSSKVQKVENTDKGKSSPKSSKIQTELNVKEHLDGFTEDEKNAFKAVLGPNRSIVVKKIKLQHPAHTEPELVEENVDFKVEKVADRKVFNCNKCSYTSSKRDCMLKHQEEHAVNMTMKCPNCSYSCSQIRALKAHFATQHSKLKQQICELCGEICKDRVKLQNHMTSHTGEHRFECNQCDYKTNVKLSFTDHMKKHAGIYLSCDKEGCEFKTFYHRVLVQHKKKHDGLKQLVCEYCQYSTAEAGSLKRHIQLQHLKERNFKCSKCNYYSVNKYDVIIHLRNKHFQMKPYQCNQCDFKTGYANGLKYHLMQHAGIRPFKCSACDYHVNKSDVIKRHIKTVHADEPGVTIEKIDLPYQLDSKKFKCQDADNDASELEQYIIELTGEDKKQIKHVNKTKSPKDKVKEDNKNASDSKVKKADKTAPLKADSSSLLNNMVDMSQIPNKRKTVSLIVPKGKEFAKGKGSLQKSKSNNSFPSSMSSLIKTISIPAPEGSTLDEITTFQCSVCLSMFTSVLEIMEHILNCRNNEGSGK